MQMRLRVIVVYAYVDTSFLSFCIKECDVNKWTKLCVC